MALASTNVDFRRKVEQINELPTLPELVRQLLALQVKANAGVKELVAVIEHDPVSSSQILKYANSAFFNSARKIESLTDAVNLFGFDNALNCSISLATAQKFTIPLAGPIGMREFWKQAIYSAHLMNALARKIPLENGPKPGLAYLAGLLHNVGYLLLGHIFPEEFNRLNKSLAISGMEDTLLVEADLLGIHHYQLALWLMRKWGLPTEILVAVFEHHNEKYRGKHCEYANLTLLTDRILFSQGIGDANTEELPPRILSALNIDHLVVKAVTKELFVENKEKIDGLIEKLIQ